MQHFHWSVLCTASNVTNEHSMEVSILFLSFNPDCQFQKCFVCPYNTVGFPNIVFNWDPSVVFKSCDCWETCKRITYFQKYNPSILPSMSASDHLPKRMNIHLSIIIHMCLISPEDVLNFVVHTHSFEEKTVLFLINVVVLNCFLYKHVSSLIGYKNMFSHLTFAYVCIWKYVDLCSW